MSRSLARGDEDDGELDNELDRELAMERDASGFVLEGLMLVG